MRVSSRYAAALAAVAGAILVSAAAAEPAPTPPSPPPPAHNPCCGHPGGPVINAPGVHIGGPSVHVGGPSIYVGGSTAHSSVNVNVSASASASAIATGSARAGAGGQTFIYSGGGYVSGGHAPAATALTGLRLAGSAVETIEEERTRIVETWRVVRAVCVDDRGAPHPASQVDPGERVAPDFDGELFRCMAGTALQANLGWREDGADRFDGGEVISCEKGDALRHGPGGRLYCATQIPQRDCNERSLLRLHGPGVKLVYLRYEESYVETVEQRVARAESSSMTLMLDGGVGGWR